MNALQPNNPSTTLKVSFLRAVVLMIGFKPKLTRGVQAALLSMALRFDEFTAADLPAEITQGSKHVAGAASGTLVALGLIKVIRREPSPNKNAKGRKLDVFCLADGKRGAVKAWLRANEFDLKQINEEEVMLQPELVS